MYAKDHSDLCEKGDSKEYVLSLQIQLLIFLAPLRGIGIRLENYPEQMMCESHTTQCDSSHGKTKF